MLFSPFNNESYSQRSTGLNETPIYEFGYGLSYTNFSYSNLQIIANASAPAYTAASGTTSSAPSYGVISNNTADYQFPAGFHQVPFYIYPYLNASTLSGASQDPQYGINYTFPSGAYDSSPQPILPAGGASGGNPRLYDILFTVTATIKNTGSVAGEEVAQLYVSLGGPNDPVVALRQFDKLPIPAGGEATFSAQLTRRDLSNWDTVAQDWFVSKYRKTVFVGSSSRRLPLSGVLDIAGTAGGIGSSGGNGTSSSYSSGSGSGSASVSGGVSGSGSVTVSGGVSGSGSATASGHVSGGIVSGSGSASGTTCITPSVTWAPEYNGSWAGPHKPGWTTTW